MPFNNLINEWYSRDISKKMRAMIQQKGTSGKRLCTRPIYGYMLDPTDPEKWVIDEYAANIVRRIYAMYLSGMGVTQIARTFTKKKSKDRAYIFIRKHAMVTRLTVSMNGVKRLSSVFSRNPNTAVIR